MTCGFSPCVLACVRPCDQWISALLPSEPGSAQPFGPPLSSLSASYGVWFFCDQWSFAVLGSFFSSSPSDPSSACGPATSVYRWSSCVWPSSCGLLSSCAPTSCEPQSSFDGLTSCLPYRRYLPLVATTWVCSLTVGRSLQTARSPSLSFGPERGKSRSGLRLRTSATYPDKPPYS